MSIEGQGNFLTIYFPGFVCFGFSRPRYQVSVYMTIGPLVLLNSWVCVAPGTGFLSTQLINFVFTGNKSHHVIYL